MNTEELQTLEIPLSKLLAWNDNVRTIGVEEGIGELADSIGKTTLFALPNSESRFQYSQTIFALLRNRPFSCPSVG